MYTPHLEIAFEVMELIPHNHDSLTKQDKSPAGIEKRNAVPEKS
jgi:hypothetical protein